MLLLLYDRNSDMGEGIVHVLDVPPTTSIRPLFHEFLGILAVAGRADDALPIDEFGDWLIAQGYATDRFGDIGSAWGFMEFIGDDTVADALSSEHLWLEDYYGQLHR